MPTVLRDRIQVLAAEFAAGVVRAIRAASLEDILEQAGEGKRRGPARPRKVDAPALPTTTRLKVSAIATLIVGHVKANPGTTGEAARKALGVPKPRWNPAVTKAIKGGQLRKEGERRATRYWAT